MDLQVPGMHTEAVPKLTQGSMWNSVFTIVGQMGTSNGIETGPTLSGGMGLSGTQGRYPASPAEQGRVTPIASMTSTRRTATLEDLIAIPQHNVRITESHAKSHKNINDTLSSLQLSCQGRSRWASSLSRAEKDCHCERSEAIPTRQSRDCFVISLLAMTQDWRFPRLS